MNALGRHQAAHPAPAATIPGESAVACGCCSMLHRTVKFQSLAGPGVLRACMKCGAVTCAEALRALMRKVARHDATLVNCIRVTLRELESPAPLRCG